MQRIQWFATDFGPRPGRRGGRRDDPAAVAAVAERSDFVLPLVIEAVKADATVQEVREVFREQFGEYQPGM